MRKQLTAYKSKDLESLETGKETGAEEKTQLGEMSALDPTCGLCGDVMGSVTVVSTMAE